MKKSFRKQLFIRIFLAVVLIHLVNRITAQIFLEDQINERVIKNIAQSQFHCQNQIGNKDNYFACIKQKGREDIIASLTEYYVLWEIQNSQIIRGNDPVCYKAFTNKNTQATQEKFVYEQSKLVPYKIDDNKWISLQLEKDGNTSAIFLPQKEIDLLVASIYTLRDNLYRLIIPVILLAILLLTLYLIEYFMAPIKSIEKALNGLTSKNLDKPLNLLPPFKEFESFIAVFDELRERLNKSFSQTRRFAAYASHELRTPLTILRGNAEKLIGELPVGSELQIRIRMMGDEVERLIEITEKLLLLSRAEANTIPHNICPVSLSDLINQLALDAKTFQSDLEITTNIAPGIHWECDEGLFQQLLYNLFTNAVKYNVPNGWICLSLFQHESNFVLTIENPSENLAPDLTEKAFEHFYRGDQARNRQIDGLGLGLSLSLEIAKLHQAELTLEVTERKTVIARLEAPLKYLADAEVAL